jgi:hypothetical protein
MIVVLLDYWRYSNLGGIASEVFREREMASAAWTGSKDALIELKTRLSSISVEELETLGLCGYDRVEGTSWRVSAQDVTWEM